MARNKFDIDEKLETPFNIAHLKRSSIYIKKYKGKMILSLFLSMSSALFMLITPLLVEQALNVAVPNKDLNQVYLLAFIMAVCIIISVFLGNRRSRIMVVVGQSIVYDIRKDVFEHLQKLPFQYYDDHPQGKILIRVINYVNSVSDMLSNGIINFVLEIFNLVLISIFMLNTNATLSSVVFAGIPIFFLITFIIKPAQRKSWQEVSNKSSNLNAYLAESIDGMKITQAFVREEQNAEIFDRLNKNAVKTWMTAQYITNLVQFSVDNISILVVSSMYIVGLEKIGPDLQIGTLIAISAYAWRFWQPILSLSNIYNNVMNSIAYLERIFELLDEPVVVTDIEGAVDLPEINGDVTFDDVTFSYDGKKTILKNLSFDVKAGQSIALVGPTGAGKSTIVNLLSRFYNINSGAVKFDGNDIGKCTLNSLRTQMGIMLQDSFIFSGTIMDNIKYGNLDATDEQAIEACKTVCAHEFIIEFEDGYKTEVNERGSRLSQGQKQLIAFARTLLSDPKILVLDEATSSIDAKTERLLQQGLQALLKNRTSFIIAHRLSTIKNCDKIMYVCEQNIAEAGSHDELIAKQGLYYKLYTAQED